MAVVRVVEVAVDQVVDVVTVGHGLVSAALAMPVAGIVRAAGVIRRALRRVRAPDRETVFVHVVGVRMVQVAIVQVVRMTIVTHGGVAAAITVDVFVTVVSIAGQGQSPLPSLS